MPGRLPDLVLWDVDRTLLDAGPATHTAMTAALRIAAGVELGDDTGKQLTGTTDRAVIRGALRGAGWSEPMIDKRLPAVLAELVEQFGRLRHRVHAEGGVLPGVAAALAALGRYGTVHGLVTGAVAANTALKLRVFDLDGWFGGGPAAYGDDHEDRRALVSTALRRAAADFPKALCRQHVWLVGDTPNDADAGRAAGLRTLLVGTGLYSPAELRRASADRFLPDLSDCQAVLRALTTEEPRRL
ncbi:MAG TPA: HAD hydrolase-like protein [Pseudonocardiaceae bacterium]|jgi:phosphoglycolate phosphatase-like HAD superfamily hydrolase|nr:HAD hydrolase-like protein [Pseudonocardiaceae bacterium]